MNSNKPRYRLKKDWLAPGSSNNHVVKAGTTFRFKARIGSDVYITDTDDDAEFSTAAMENNEWFERIEEPRGWKVIDGWYSANDTWNDIKSVMRMSDGVIFTIGDMVKWEFTTDRPTEFQKIDEFIFHKSSGKINAHCRSKNLTFDLPHIHHYKEPFQWTDELVLKAHKDWWVSLQNNNGTVLKFDYFLKEFKNKNS